MAHKLRRNLKKRPVYIFAFGVYNSKQVNVSGIKIFCAQFLALYLRKVMLKHLPVWNYAHYYRWWKIPGLIPTDLSKTIDNVLNSFILTKWKLVNKWPLPWYHHSLYTGQRRYILLLYYPEFLELGTGTCKASASSMLREGDWSHVQDMTTPGFRPTPCAGMNSPRLSRFSSC